jgi:hypothetical protein
MKTFKVLLFGVLALAPITDECCASGYTPEKGGEEARWVYNNYTEVSEYDGELGEVLCKGVYSYGNEKYDAKKLVFKNSSGAEIVSCSCSYQRYGNSSPDSFTISVYDVDDDTRNNSKCNVSYTASLSVKNAEFSKNALNEASIFAVMDKVMRRLKNLKLTNSYNTSECSSIVSEVLSEEMGIDSRYIRENVNNGTVT